MTDLLPNNSTPQERALALATSRISAVPVPARDLWNAATCPVDLLPWLAWTFSVEAWNPEWPEHLKRSVIASAVDIAKRKGTKQAVIDALSAIGGSAVLVEWFEKTPAGPAHTFEIDIVGNTTTTEMQDMMVAEVNRTKPLRSHFTVNFGVELTGTINICAILRPVVFIRIDGSSIIGNAFYYRPGGSARYLRPDENSTYLR
jgi:phage tail P2-like protein